MGATLHAKAMCVSAPKSTPQLTHLLQCMEFKGPAFRYLAALYCANTTQALYSFLQSSVLSLWNSAQSQVDGASLFAIDWTGPPQRTVYASQQNAAVTAFNIFAELC